MKEETGLLERYQRKFEFYKNKVDLKKVSAVQKRYKDYRANKDLKLEVELVPTSCWWSNIRSNIKVSEWDRIRFVTGGLADFKCEICGDRGTKHPVECHEIWMYDEKKKIQKLLKFQSICPLCHQVKHLGLTQGFGREIYNRAVDRFTRLNDLTITSSHELIKQAVTQFKNRSSLKWKLDVSLLSHYNITIKAVDR
jgi:5-methylcytosine-specific restriction endonuclease McrA